MVNIALRWFANAQNEPREFTTTYDDDLVPAKFHIKGLVDFNGDGNTDCIFHDAQSAANTMKILYSSRDSRDKFIDQIINGTNVRTDISYQPISSGINYTKGSGASYPLMDFQGVLYVANSVVTRAGSQILSNLSYSYEGAKVHKLGKGFLGFTKFNKLDNASDIKAVGTFAIKIINDKYFYTYPSRNIVSRPGKTISSSHSTIDLSTYSYGKRFLPYLKSSVQRNIIDDIKVSTKYNTYDDYGNPTNITREYKADDESSDGTGTVEALITTAAQYWPAENSYLPSSVTVTSQRLGQTDIVRSSTISYTDKHLPDIIKKDPGTAFELWEDNNYDGCGNLTSKKFMDKNSTELRKVSFTYDTKKRFVATTTNALGHSSSNLYDEITGNILVSTNAQNLSTSNTYDNFGRLIATSTPNGATTRSFAWCDDSDLLTDRYSIQSINLDNSYLIEYFDAAGRKVGEKTPPPIGSTALHTNKVISYNAKGQLASVSEPTDNINAQKLVNYAYDDYGRITDVTSYKQDISYSYPEPRKKVVTNNLSTAHTSWQKTNSLGEVIQAKDPGGDLLYTYNAVGLPLTIEAPGGIITEMYYNRVGLQDSLVDPSAGKTAYEYDLLGQLTKQTDAKGNVYQLTYDALGRVLTKTNATEGTTTYSYVSSGNGLGLLQSVSNSLSGISNNYTYDEYARVNTTSETINTNNYTYDYTYDLIGRVTEMEYPGDDFSIKYGYGTYGELKEITDASENTIWEITEMSPQGELKEITYGNGLTTNYTYDSNHQLTTIKTENASSMVWQHLQFSFDYMTGNLNSRTDVLADDGRGLTESFLYDDLDRLTSYKVGSNTANTISYDDDGSGRYTYGENNAPEHALTSITGTDGTMISQTQQNISYTTFNKVAEITQGTKKLEITHGPGRKRKITKLYNGTNLVLEKTFVGDLYEIEENQAGNIRHLYYIPGPTGEAAIFEKLNSDPGEMYYIHKDYLGSYQTITDEGGASIEILSFDPWGRRRNSDSWNSSSVPASFLFDRGYTGHEHLEEFDLINMNGRIYDPLACLFLSPDNYVQSPGFTQSFNRYGYCLNNPLKFTDPTGEKWWHWLLAAVNPIAYFQGVAYHDGETDAGMWDWNEAFFKIGVETDMDGNKKFWAGYGWDPNLVAAGGFDTQDGAVGGFVSEFSRLQSPVPGTSAEEITDQGINASRAVYGDDPWQESDDRSGHENTLEIGWQITAAAVPGAGGVISTGEFNYKGNKYGYFTYGLAFGADAGVSISGMLVRAPSNFDPLNDFKGKSRANSYSFFVNWTESSSVSYNRYSNLWEADHNVWAHSLGPSYGLRIGYSHHRTRTRVWRIPTID